MKTFLKRSFLPVFFVLIVIGVFSAAISLSATRMRLKEHELETQLLRHAKRISLVISPEMASMLGFTGEDEGTFHFEHIRRQLGNYADENALAGVYTIAPVNERFVFGPGKHGGITQRSLFFKGVPEHLETLSAKAIEEGQPKVLGPHETEYGSFFTALAPLSSPHSTRPPLLVAVDVPSEKWTRSVSSEAVMPVSVSLGLLIFIVLGGLALKNATKRYDPVKHGLKVWVLLPSSIAIIAFLLMFATVEYYRGLRLLRREAANMGSLAEEKWGLLLLSRARVLSDKSEEILNDREILKAWRENSMESLLEESRPFYEDLSRRHGVTRFSFFDEKGDAALKVHSDPEKNESPRNSTVRASAHAQKGIWAVERTPSDRLLLNHVQPLPQGEHGKGYLQLGTDLEHLKDSLSDFFNVEVKMILKEGAADKVEQLKEGAPSPFVNTIPVLNAAGEKTAVLLLIADENAWFSELQNELLYSVSVALAIVLGIIGLLWLIANIAEKKLRKSYDDILESRRRISVTLDSIGDAVISADNEGFIVRMNPVAEELTGWSLEEAEGKPVGSVLRIVDTRTRQSIPDIAARVMDEKGRIELSDHKTLISRYGVERQIADSAAPIMGEEKDMLGVVIVFHDVTERYKAGERLKDSQRRLSVATRGTGTGVWDYDLKTGLLVWDETMFELYGTNEDDFTRDFEGFIRHVAPDERDNVRQNFQKSVEGLEDFDMEFPIEKGNGEIRYLAGVATVLKDHNGEPSRVIGINYDITYRKNAENRLLRLSFAVEQSPASVVVTDINGNITYVNSKFSSLTGYSYEEALGENPRILKSGEQPDEFYKELWDTITSGKEWRGEFRNKKKNGELYWEKALISPVFEKNGTIIHFVAVKEDITEQRRIQKALEREERRFEQLARQSRSMVWEIDREGLYTYVSSVSKDLTGYDPEELVGEKHFFDICPEEDRKKIKESAFEKMERREELKKNENRLVRKDGSTVWFLSSGMPVVNKNGEVVGFQGNDTDINELKKAEEAWRESEKRFKDVMYASTDAILLIENSRLVDCNDTALRMFGYSQGRELLGRSFSELAPEFQADREASLEMANKMMKEAFKNGFKRFEWMNLRSDGEVFPVEVSMTPIIHEKKDLLYCVLRDIGKEKLAQEQIKIAQKDLRRTSRQYKSLVANVPGIVYRCANDEEWTMFFISDEVSRMTGYDAKDFMGNAARSYRSVIHPEDRPGVEKRIRTSLAERAPYVLEYRVISSSGAVIWVQERGRGVFDGEEVKWLDGVITDITVLKRAEEQMKLAADMQMEFTSTVSHELRTPLTAIREGIAIVSDGSAGDINDVQQDFLDTAKRNVDRLTRLINDVLDFQKLKVGKAEMELKIYGLNDTLKEAHKQMGPQASKKGLDFILDLGKNVPPIKFDQDAIMRVLVNLLNNAFKFTDEGSVRLASCFDEDKNYVSVIVEDTGPGVDPEDVSKLFNDFEQLQKGKDRKTGGTGLGLPISKKIVEEHGGKIWAESEKGKGTRITFILPVLERRGRSG